MFHLETHLKTTKTLSWISGIYWSARDFIEVGNHHFITFIYKSDDQAIRITRKWNIKYQTVTNDMGVRIPFSTMGITTDTGGLGNIIFQFNPKSDLTSIQLASRKASSIVSDYEGHRALYTKSRNNITSNEMLMDEILQRVFNFNAHYKIGERIDYVLWDENCAAGVNSIFRVLGYPLDLRKNLGDFKGIDWGEEDKIPSRYFAPLPGVGVKTTYPRVEPSWLSILLS